MVSYSAEEARIYRMTKARVTELLHWLIEENLKTKHPISVDEVTAKFYRSKTFEYLMDPETDFSWKSIIVLKKMLQWEYKGNTVRWNAEALN